MAVDSKANDIKIIRLYDAPIKAVWDAWSDPSQLAEWWGPRGFRITTASKDMRPWGTWRFTMHGPNNVDYPSLSTYIEVKDLARLVYDHGAPDASQPAFRTTVEFSEQLGKTPKTQMIMTMTLPSVEAAAAARKVVKEASGESTWDRLAEFLAKKLHGRSQFVINRSFNVSKLQMFEGWTNPEHLIQWLPPTGAMMKFIRADIRPNGSNFYVMEANAGTKMYGVSRYLAIDPPHGLIYLQQFCDEHEKPARHPMSATWPVTMQTTVAFEEEKSDQTRINLIWEPHGAVLPEELETFISARAGMTQGWTGLFNKLEEYLGRVFGAGRK